MLTVCRRHSRKCSKEKKIPIHELGKCRCPLMIMGKDHFGGYHDREALNTKELPVAYERLGRIERGEPNPISHVEYTVPDALEAYRSILLTQRKLKVSTVESTFDTVRRRMIKQAEEMGIKEVAGLGTDYLDRLLGSWAGLESGTIGIRMGVVKRFFAAAHAREWVSKNPALVLMMPVVSGKGGGTAPFELGTEDKRVMEGAWEWEKGLKTRQITRMSTWLRVPRTATAMILLMRYTGLRFSDAAMFRPERFTKRDFKGKEMYCIEALKQKKTDRALFLPVESEIAEVILSAKRVSREWVFWDGKTSMQDWNNRFLYGVMVYLERVSGVGNLHPHRFRDTFAVDWLSKGLDIRSLSRLLGHRSIGTTLDSYEHWVREDQDNLVDLMMKVRDRDREKGMVIEFPLSREVR